MVKPAPSAPLDGVRDDAGRNDAFRLGALVADQAASWLEPAMIRSLLERPEVLHGALLQAVGHDPALDRRMEPSLELGEARRRLVTACVPSIAAESVDAIGAAELAKRLGLGSRQTVYDRAARGELIGFDVAAGRRYPLAQFDERGCVLRGVAETLATLEDPWATWLWLTRPSATLDGTVPIERLHAGGDDAVDDVLDAARAERDGAYQ